MKNKITLFLLMVSSSYATAATELFDSTIISQLAIMKEQCESCSIAMQDYLLIRRSACGDSIDAVAFEKAFSTSPMITAMMTVHSIDAVAYKTQFIPMAKKNVNCKNDSSWLDATRENYSKQYSN